MAKQNTPTPASIVAAPDIAPGKQLTIELLKPHTHAGRTYPVGARLTLDADSARWLIDIGTAEAFL